MLNNAKTTGIFSSNSAVWKWLSISFAPFNNSSKLSKPTILLTTRSWFTWNEDLAPTRYGKVSSKKGQPYCGATATLLLQQISRTHHPPPLPWDHPHHDNNDNEPQDLQLRQHLDWPIGCDYYRSVKILHNWRDVDYERILLYQKYDNIIPYMMDGLYYRIHVCTIYHPIWCIIQVVVLYWNRYLGKMPLSYSINIIRGSMPMGTSVLLLLCHIWLFEIYIYTRICVSPVCVHWWVIRDTFFWLFFQTTSHSNFSLSLWHVWPGLFLKVWLVSYWLDIWIRPNHPMTIVMMMMTTTTTIDKESPNDCFFLHGVDRIRSFLRSF